MLTPDYVRKYLKRGNGDISDAECEIFIKLCQYQRLNPFTGEAHLIKYGSAPASMVIGYDTYKRRADENPDYRGIRSGITIFRGQNIVQKEGTCLYPGEQLIGGWARVQTRRHGEFFKEVAFSEYDQQQANWKTKPSTMINKVAVSQALRTAFPKDYSGLYTEEEIGPRADGKLALPDPATGEIVTELLPDPELARPATVDEKKMLFRAASDMLKLERGGEESAEEFKKRASEAAAVEVKTVLARLFGLSSTLGLTKEQTDKALMEIKGEGAPEQIAIGAGE